jgi:hypothetical protein
VTASIGTIAQQSLRRLGVRVVPLDDSPTITEMVPVADIAAAALEELGVLTGGSAASGAIVTPTAIATSALVDLGVLNSDGTPSTAVVSPTTIATSALVDLGVLNSDLTLAVPATVPQATIATAALTELGVIASDETPSTADQALAVDKVASVHGSLVDQGIALWDVSAIPRAFAEEYTKLTAAMAASSFGRTVDPAVVALLEGRVRVGAQVLNADPAFMLDMVLRVHDSLFTQGIALWTSAAIPRALAEEYTKLTAAYTASAFGKSADPQVIALLEDRVRKSAQVLNADPAFMLDMVLRVHDGLAAQGIASWASTAIPHAFAEEYTKLTAGYAAAAFGKAIDPQVVALLEGRVRAGATVLNADMPFMLGKVASVHASLDAQGVVWWDGTAVPRAFAEEYTKLTAAYAAASLGQKTDPATIPALEARVRKGVMVLSADDNAQQAVQAVHDDLVMRGCARWSVFDIPDAVGNAYAVLAADRLAPLFGMDTDAKDTTFAMVAIYRYVALPTSGETVAAAYF